MPDFAVLWTRSAEADLTAIVDYIEAESPANAAKVLQTLQRRAQTLETQPARGRIVPELRAIEVRQYREVIERPWRIIYRIEQSRVLVMAVFDSRRELESMLLDRLVQS